MGTRAVRSGAALLVLAVLLTACASLPGEAREVALRPFGPDQRPRVRFARQANLLPEDEEAGADEVWCVSVAFRCRSGAQAEWHTCVSSYLMRRIDGTWEAVGMATREDWERWEARGCPREPDIVERPPVCQDMLADVRAVDLQGAGSCPSADIPR